jgi:uncharacterized protein (DUF934 family)
MPPLIRDRRIVADDAWLLIKPTSDGVLPAIPVVGDVIVPLSVWRESKQQLLARDGRLGVWLDSHEEPAAIAFDLAHFAVVAVNFPTHVDGRAYSIARLLRERYAYTGELRAIGDVLRDQIFYMHRCGFNSFALRADKNIENALPAFSDFSESYQTAVDQPVPLFRRRLQ